METNAKIKARALIADVINLSDWYLDFIIMIYHLRIVKTYNLQEHLQSLEAATRVVL